MEKTGFIQGLADDLRKALAGLDFKKIICQLACGKVVEDPFPASICSRFLDLMLERLEAQGISTVGLEVVAEGQTFRLRLMEAILKHIGDPDWEILCARPDSFTTGVNIGVLIPSPRTPAVFERKVKFRKYDEDDPDVGPSSKENYKSVGDNLEAIRSQFEEEAAMGHMRKVTNAEAAEICGAVPLCAAQGAIEKDDDTFRVIHDGTHGVWINPQIVPRDQVRSPSVGEMRSLMGVIETEGLPCFTLKGDASKAHRRVKVRQKDWRYQGCRLEPDSVWLNLVGTFGIGSAGYWWSRLAGCAGRISLYLARQDPFWQLVFADDFAWVVSGPHAFPNLVMTILVLKVLGMPFSWKKFAGGLTMDWIGYWVDVGLLRVGISQGRTAWLINNAKEMLEAGSTLVSRFVEVLGRWGFATNALETLKPFLGPMYGWAASVPEGSYLQLPVFIRLLFMYLVRRLEAGGVERPPLHMEIRAEELFRGDAKAEGQHICIGGWELQGNRPVRDCRWFSITLDKKNAPWAFVAGEPFRTIAALELLTSLMCVVVFNIKSKPGIQRLTIAGTTDNLGNTYVTRKLMTTRFPLNVILMEVAAQLDSRELDLELNWAPRDQNEEADQLTNSDFRSFQKDLRVEWDYSSTPFIVLEELIGAGADMFKDNGRVEDAMHSGGPEGVQDHWGRKRRKKSKMAGGLKLSDPW